MNDQVQVKELLLEDILPNRFQPRVKFSESEVLALAESIKNHGVIHPILVRPIGDKYEIIAGERRYKASEMAGKKTIPAIIKQLDDNQSAELALIENVQRKDLTPIEEAQSYRKVLDMGYLTQEQLAQKLGKKQSTIANKLRLLNLDEDVQNALLYEKISERHARSLLKLSRADQKKMLKEIIDKRLTVRQTDLEIQKLLNAKQQQSEPNNTDEIEILDFPEEETVNKMNDNMTGQFGQYNIPTQGIQNDVPNTQGSITQQTINPGFMDVDKIVNTAQDINRANGKDKKTIEDLLKPDDQMLQMEQAEREASQQSEPALKPGKFFNLADLEATDHSSQSQNNGYVENIDRAQANMDFGVKPTPTPVTNFDFDKFFDEKELGKTLEPVAPTPTPAPVTPAPVTENDLNKTVSLNPKGEENPGFKEIPATNESLFQFGPTGGNTTSGPVNMESKQETISNISSENSMNSNLFTPSSMVQPSVSGDHKEQLFDFGDEKEESAIDLTPHVEEEKPAAQQPEQLFSFHSTEPQRIVPPTPAPIEQPRREDRPSDQLFHFGDTSFSESMPKSESFAIHDTPTPKPVEPEIPIYTAPKPEPDPVSSVSNLDRELKIQKPKEEELFNDIAKDEKPLPIPPKPQQPESTTPGLIEPTFIDGLDKDIMPIEPSITNDTNSFLFDPEEPEETSTSFKGPGDSAILNEPSLQQPVEVPVPPARKEVQVEPTPKTGFDIQKVSGEVKSFAESLQQKGYQIRIEEYDFEDLYQVVFKIRKEDE